MSIKDDGGRKIAMKMPLIAALLGMAVVFTGVVLFYFANPGARLASVSVGALLMLGGIWYAGNPYIKSSRRFLKLRAEMEQFIRLARVLNDAKDQPHEMDEVVAAMHKSVDQMGEYAGRPDR